MEYPKTENLYARDPVTHEVGPRFGFRQEAVGLVNRWLVTEKVDGMNMRVTFVPELTGNPVTFAGRTDRAQIPGDLLKHMQDTFTADKLSETFNPEGDQPPESVVLFGEGYGPGIQKAGQAYGGAKRFILFDVLVNGTWWLDWDDVVDVGCKLGVPTVPVLCENCDLETTKTYVQDSRLQQPGGAHVEGIVARTVPNIFDSRGRLVRFKYKVRDLA